MRKFPRAVMFFFIVIVFGLLQIATSKDDCFGDCQLIADVQKELYQTRNYKFVQSVDRCPYLADTLCVRVKYTSGVDWNALADTTCTVAKYHGLEPKAVFVLAGSYPYDTVGRITCP